MKKGRGGIARARVVASWAHTTSHLNNKKRGEKERDKINYGRNKRRGKSNRRAHIPTMSDETDRRKKTIKRSERGNASCKVGERIFFGFSQAANASCRLKPSTDDPDMCGWFMTLLFFCVVWRWSFLCRSLRDGLFVLSRARTERAWFSTAKTKG